MARPRLRGVLLCEDREHERFFSRLLSRWFARGRLRVERIPDGKGAGDAFVIASYAKEVRFARSKRHENYALVAVVDGDLLKLSGRMRQLEQSLADAGLEGRDQAERIAVFVPTRNVETWQLWLGGRRDLDEETDYKREVRDAASVKRAVDAWFEDLSPAESTLESETLPALAAGRAEIRRLDRS